MTQKIEQTPEQIKDLAKGNKLNIGLEIDAKDPKQVALLHEVLPIKKQLDEYPLDEATQAGKDLFLDMTEKASVELTALGINTESTDIKTKADLDRAIQTIKTVKESKKQTAKPETPAGSAPMNIFQLNGGQQQATDLAHTKFPNIETAISTLQSEKKKGNPEAEPLLQALWKSGIAAWKEAGRPAQSTSPDANIIDKTTDIPTINFDDPKINDVQGFPQIKKSPYNYSKTHNAAGQLKDGAK